LSEDGLTHYFFNDAGFEIREDFSHGKTMHWSLRRIRDANTNAVRELKLVCGGGQKVELPPALDTSLGKSEAYIPYFSQYCARMGKQKTEAKNFSRKPSLVEDQGR